MLYKVTAFPRNQRGRLDRLIKIPTFFRPIDRGGDGLRSTKLFYGALHPSKFLKPNLSMNIMNVKTRLITVVSAVAVSCLTFILSNTVLAQLKEPDYTSGSARRVGSESSSSQISKSKVPGGAIVATQVTPQDAAKKYPAPKGKYPMGERDPHNADGVVTSPYPPRTAFDCSNVPHGVWFSTRTSIRSLSGRSSIVIRTS
jgi:hypothetical protein